MIDFLKYKTLYFLFSFVIIAVGVFSIINWGYKFSIEFVGGGKITLKTNLDTEDISQILKDQETELISINKKNNVLQVQTEYIDDPAIQSFSKAVKTKDNKAEILQVETIEPSFSLSLRQKMITASILAIIIIIMYISFAFKGFLFAISAIIAALHDSLILLGTYSLLSYLLGFEFDSLFITAVLTTLSFSVHDTIVVFDKIREYHSFRSQEGLNYAANKALTETMVRSLNNSFTIIFVLTALIIFGGETIKHFVYALLIGTIAGTYSSPFIATPVFVLLKKRFSKN